MAKILIIADDLTGAADCGVVFAQRGMEAAVLLRRAGEEGFDCGGAEAADVVAIDADTRCVDPEQAGEAVSRIVDWYGSSQRGTGLVFKKVDSTLRGNVAAELAAALKARRAQARADERVTILFAPAFPAQGRTTVNGRQMVHGRPLAEADVWRGERTRPDAEIAAMLERAGLACGAIELGLIRGGVDALGRAMVRIASEADVVICDAKTEEDLEAIARAGVSLGGKTIWAGSAGLARYVCEAAGLARGAGRGSSNQVRVRGPALFVVGSASAVSREQADALAGLADISRCTFSISGSSERDSETAARIEECMADGCDVLVQFDPAYRCDGEEGRTSAQLLARVLEPCGRYAEALVATGGETARAILDVWGVRSLRLLGEVERGLPWSAAECGNREVLVLTKAGAFGTRETLIRCREFVHGFANDCRT